jgi:hypothetical protein
LHLIVQVPKTGESYSMVARPVRLIFAADQPPSKKPRLTIRGSACCQEITGRSVPSYFVLPMHSADENPSVKEPDQDLYRIGESSGLSYWICQALVTSSLIHFAHLLVSFSATLVPTHISVTAFLLHTAISMSLPQVLMSESLSLHMSNTDGDNMSHPSR